MVLLQKTLEPPKRFKLPKLIPDEKNVFNWKGFMIFRKK
jgi:hypothetical protein